MPGDLAALLSGAAALISAVVALIRVVLAGGWLGWVLTVVFTSSTFYAAYVGIQGFMVIRAATEEVRLFAPGDLSPGALARHSENANMTALGTPESIVVPAVEWSKWGPNHPEEPVEGKPPRWNSTGPKEGYPYFYSSHFAPGAFSYVQISSLQKKYDLLGEADLFLVVRSAKQDRIELKLIDGHGKSSAFWIQINKGWHGYKISLNLFEVDRTNVKTLQLARASGSATVNTLLIPWIDLE
jgi:hypothetical protein